MALSDKQLQQIFDDTLGAEPSQGFKLQHNVGQAYPSEQAGPNVEYLVTGLPNGGVVVRGPDGKLYYKDESVAGGEELARPVIEQLQKGVPKSEIRTPRQEIESEMRQEVIQQAGGLLPSLMGPKKLEGTLFVGSYMDELAGQISKATGANPDKVKQDYQTISNSVQGEYPVLSELFKTYGLLDSSIAAYYLSKAVKMPAAISQPFQKAGEAINKLPPLGQQIANVGGATSLAATEGFVYGTGEGEDLEGRIAQGLNRARDAAIIAAPLAAIFPYLGRMAQNRAGDKATIQDLATRLGISVEASRFIFRDLKDGATLEEAVNNLQRAGQNRMVADANEAAATLLDSAAASSPAARQQADTAVTGRVEEESRRITGGLDETIGQQAPRGMTTEQAVMESTKEARQKAYEEAYAPKVDVMSPEGNRVVELLETLDAEDLEEQLKRANKLLRNKAEKVEYEIVDGKVVFATEPTVKFLDSLKKSLQSQAQGLKLQDPEMSNLYNAIARDVKDVTSGVSEAYGKAVDLGGDVIATRKAGELGEQALEKRTSLDEVIATLQGSSKTELMAARAGLRRNLDNILMDVTTAAGSPNTEAQDQMRKLLSKLSSAANKQKLSVIMGTKDAQKFLNDLDQAKAAFELKSRISVGSGTAQRQAFQKSLDKEASGGFKGRLLTGDTDVIGDIRDFLTGAGKEWVEGRKEDILRDLINVLAERKGKDADLAMQYIREAAKGSLSPVKATFVAKTLQGAALPSGAGILGERLMSIGE